MSVLGLMQNTADIGQTTPDLSALPSTNVDRMGTAFDAAQSPDRYWNVQGARKQRADKIIDDLHAMTGERLKNPYDNSPTQDEIRENLGQPTTVIYAKRLEALREKTRNARAGIEQFGGLPQDYLDVDSIDASIAQESGARRARDERMTGTGGGLGGFLGAAGGEMLSPHGIMSSFIPVSRMPTAIVETTIAGFARNVAKEALLQGGAQGAAQALGTLVDYQTRKEFGTEQTTQQIIEEILSAAGGGAILGGAFRATHLGILKLASRGVEIPPAVLDAARVQEGADLYGNKNPLRVQPAAHETAADQATGAAMVGRAASPDVPSAVADTARASHPDLMLRHDALTQTIDDIRARLNPTDETITHLRGQVDEINARIREGGPQTQEQAARLGGIAKAREIELQEALARQAALARGEAVETPYTASLRQQLLTAQDDLRALSPQMKEALGPDIMTRLAEERARPPQAAPAAGGEPPPLQHRPDFYEWQKTNRLAGEGGGPVMGYHGTTRTFERFDRAQQGSGAGLGKGEEGFFFGGTPEMANEFAGKLGEGHVQGGQVRPAYLRMENPKIITDTGGDVRTVNFGKEIAAARAEGHDGIVIRNTVEGGDVRGDTYVVFDEKNIKNFDERYAVDPELQRLVKSVEEHPENPMQAPRTTPEVAPQPATAKAPGESAEDKAVLQQAQQVLDSETLTRIDPAASSKMAAIDAEMQQAKAAVSCLAGAL